MTTAREELDRALLEMANRGDRVRCSWPDIGPWFTSEDPEERARAARRCAGCPVLELCGASADEQGEKYGVWAGIDRTTTRAKGKTA